MNRLWEAIFGLKRGFLNQPGELSLGFNPKWPQEPLISAGPLNWLLGLIALAVLGYLFLRVHPDVKPRGWRRRIGVVAGILVVLAVGRWDAWMAFGLAAVIAVTEWKAPWHWRLWLARLWVVG